MPPKLLQEGECKRKRRTEARLQPIHLRKCKTDYAKGQVLDIKVLDKLDHHSASQSPEDGPVSRDKRNKKLLLRKKQKRDNVNTELMENITVVEKKKRKVLTA